MRAPARARARGPVAQVAPKIAVLVVAGVLVMLAAVRWYAATCAVVLALYVGLVLARRSR